MYDAMLIAEYIIGYQKDKESSVSNLKLQQLLYLLQASYLQDADKPLFYDDFCAMNFGPCIEKVYLRFNEWGCASIPDCFAISSKDAKKIKEQDKREINKILDLFEKNSVSFLSRAINRQAPYRSTFVPDEKRIISKELLKDYFKED